MKLYLDPLDKEKVENKIDAMAQIYYKITTHKISILFSKPNSFQKKVLESKKQWEKTRSYLLHTQSSAEFHIQLWGINLSKT